MTPSRKTAPRKRAQAAVEQPARKAPPQQPQSVAARVAKLEEDNAQLVYYLAGLIHELRVERFRAALTTKEGQAELGAQLLASPEGKALLSKRLDETGLGGLLESLKK